MRGLVGRCLTFFFEEATVNGCVVAGGRGAVGQRDQSGGADVVAFVAATGGDAAVKEEFALRAVEDDVAGSVGAELGGDGAIGIDVGVDTGNAGGVAPEVGLDPISIDGVWLQKENMGDDVGRAMGKNAIQLVDTCACAGAFGMGKKKQGAALGVELDVLELRKSLVGTRLWASGILVFNQIQATGGNCQKPEATDSANYGFGHERW